MTTPRKYPLELRERAVRLYFESGGLAAGAHDGRAVALLAQRRERPAQLPLFELPERLRGGERPEPTLGDYDALLHRGERR